MDTATGTQDGSQGKNRPSKKWTLDTGEKVESNDVTIVMLNLSRLLRAALDAIGSFLLILLALGCLSAPVFLVWVILSLAIPAVGR